MTNSFIGTILAGTTTGGRGRDGYQGLITSLNSSIENPLFFTGGSGGGSSTTANGGRGGDGAIGCGGGGGGAGTSPGGVGGIGGRGGDGLVIITAF